MAAMQNFHKKEQANENTFLTHATRPINTLCTEYLTLKEKKMKLIYAAAVLMLSTHAFAGEAVPLSVSQDRIAKGCAAHYNYANRGGPDLHNFGGACGVLPGFTLTADTDYSHGFQVNAGGNVAIGKYVTVSVRAAIPVGGLPNLLNSVSIQPALTVHNKHLLGPLGAGAQYSANIPVAGNHLVPTRHTGKAWVSAELAKDKFDVYALASIDAFGSPGGAICRDCKVLFGASNEIRAGGGANLYLEGLRFSLEGTASVDGSPFGTNSRTLMFGITAGI